MLPCYQDNDVFQLSTKIGAMDFGFVSTYLIRLIFGKTKDRKYILQLYKDLHLRRSVFNTLK